MVSLFLSLKTTIAVVLLLLGLTIEYSTARGVAGNIKLISMKSNQYWFSTSSPYAPTLSFFLAYQYCRNLGLQLVTFETSEEVSSVAAYLTSTSDGSYAARDFWTSGNKLGGNDAWLWMSSGDQMNASFVVENGLHRQNVPTASPRNCLSMRSMSSRRTVFTPEVCEKALPFICEQIRCLSYYYPSEEFPDTAIAGPSGTRSPEFSNGLRSDRIDDKNETVSSTTEFVTEAR